MDILDTVQGQMMQIVNYGLKENPIIQADTITETVEQLMKTQ